MKNVLAVYKPIGFTPNEIILKIREQYPGFSKQQIGYAGRLDPMASGLLLLLIGDENKYKKKYEDLSKKYTISILFGLTTDTYDTLGLITTTQQVPANIDEKFLELVSSLHGSFEQPYPPYSSKTVHGKPLFYWARNNKLKDISIPAKKVTINAIDSIEMGVIKRDELKEVIINRISKVNGDFRQEKIIQSWKSFFESNKEDVFYTITCNVHCSSGTYMRSLAYTTGNKLGTGAIAYEIKRTDIGTYSIKTVLPLRYSQKA